MQAYPPLRPVEPRPAILPAQTSSSDNYRLPSSLPTAGNGAVNAEAGPSTPGPAASKKRIGVANAKKRRANAAIDDTDDSGATRPPMKQREGPKKKKAQRACAHCQKAHLTCDDTRPCQRCVKRGMAEKCTEGHRKKAKYLLDDTELDALKKGRSVTQGTPEGSQPPPSAPPTVDQFPSNDLYFNMPIDQTYSFGSEAANLEYSSLSAILGMNNYSPDQPFLTSETSPPSSAAYGSQFANAAWPSEPQPNIAPQALIGAQSSGFDTGYPAVQQNNGQYIQGGQYVYDGYNGGEASIIHIQQPNREQQQQQQQQLPVQNVNTDNPYPTPEITYANQQSFMQQTPPSISSIQQQQEQRLQQTQNQNQRAPQMLHRSSTQQSSASLVSPPNSASPAASSEFLTENGTPVAARIGETPSDVYATVTKPYSYIESYQFLMDFLHKRFNKNDILRVIRALAIYRPSMIALQTPMSDEDFVFMEKCLRRSLLELEKLISYSGTPTVVWRRTGEICLVGVEFCLLTEWKKKDLVTGRKYIYELFERQSVIEYWEKFASHAFENTTTSVFSHCVLLKPSGEPIPCTFCFSIRRDIFDLPSVVIGQWLPLM